MGPYHFLTFLSHHEQTIPYPLRCTESPLILTNTYLQWDSHYSLSSKYNVIGTLTHRAKVVCTNPESLQGELKHQRSALGKCNYPTSAIKMVQQKLLRNNQEDSSNNNSTNNNNTSTNNNGSNSTNNQVSNPTINAQRNKTTIGQIVIPYTKGISKSIKQACCKYGIQVHFKGNQNIKQILMKPKDKDPKDSKSGVIYSYQCPHLDCDEEYIGETSRMLGEKRKEHLKQSSPIHRHAQTTGHTIENSNINIMGREDQGHGRTIKESIYIRVNNPTLNQNIGKYNLNHIWNKVPFNTPGLKLDSSQHPAVRHEVGWHYKYIRF